MFHTLNQNNSRLRDKIEIVIKKLAGILPVFLALAMTLSACGGPMGEPGSNLKFRQARFAEGISILDNPYRGFFYMCGIRPDNFSTIKTVRDRMTQNLAASTAGLILVEINLNHYSNGSLSKAALDQIKTVFEILRDGKRNAIVRFVYDWDDDAIATEPDNIETIIGHIGQLGPIINEYKDVIYILQGTFTGNCGEMNNSKFESIDDYRYIADALAREVDPSIFLSVRTPWQLRGINGSIEPVDEEIAYNGSMASRMGLFNDGMLGSESDLGSYGEGALNVADPSAPAGREEELAFQEQLCSYVPNGGEAIKGEEENDAWSDLDTAIASMAQMKVTYLNIDHDINVINKWKKTTYRGEGVYSGASGYEYIAAHLGYRYMVTGAAAGLSPDDPSMMRMEFTIQNSGFAPCYRPFDARLVFSPVDEDGRPTGGRAVEVPLAIETRSLDGSSEKTFTTDIPISSVFSGKISYYSVSLGFKDPVTKRTIQFANSRKNTLEDDSVILGYLISR